MAERIITRYKQWDDTTLIPLLEERFGPTTIGKGFRDDNGVSTGLITLNIKTEEPESQIVAFLDSLYF